MAVPQGVPLLSGHDGAQRMVLQQQNTVRRGRRDPRGHGRRLIACVHEAERIQHHVRGPVGPRESALGQQLQPAAAVRAGELAHRAAAQQPGRGDPFHGVGGLVAQRAWFHSARFGGDRIVTHQLRQSTPEAYRHRQRMRRLVRTRGSGGGREVIGRGHSAQIQHRRRVAVPAGPAARWIRRPVRIECGGTRAVRRRGPGTAHGTISRCESSRPNSPMY